MAAATRQRSRAFPIIILLYCRTEADLSAAGGLSAAACLEWNSDVQRHLVQLCAAMQRARAPNFKRSGKSLRNLALVLLCGLSLWMFSATALFVQRPVSKRRKLPRTCRNSIARMSWGLLRRQHESHIRAKGLSYKCCLAWDPIVGSVPDAVTVFREVCERTMRDATASSDVSDPASRNTVSEGSLKAFQGYATWGQDGKTYCHWSLHKIGLRAGFKQGACS